MIAKRRKSRGFLRIALSLLAAVPVALAGLESSLAAEVASPAAEAPKRIVSLTPSVTETLFALGVGDRVVGVSDHCDYPPAAARLPKVGTFLLPVVEQALSLEPDLLITSPSPGNRNPVLAMQRAGVRTAVVTEGSGSLADVRASIAEVAVAAGVPEAGRSLVAALDADLAHVADAVAGRERPAAAVVVGLEPLVLAGPESYLGELIVVAGGRNVADDVGGKWPRAGWELLVAAAPEVIVDLSVMEGTGEVSSRWLSFPSLPAVRDHRVHRASELLLRPGPRVAEAARELAKLIHPEAPSSASAPCARAPQ